MQKSLGKGWQGQERVLSDKIIRYGIISDTHGHLAPAVHDVFDGVFKIFHCGDLGSNDVLHEMQTIAPLCAVHGNMDPWPVAGALSDGRTSPEKFGTAALYHGMRFGHDNGAIMNGMMRMFADESPRLYLFGHTHNPIIREQDGRLFINPGSATLPHRGEAPSVAILEYNTETDILSAHHLALPVEKKRRSLFS
ncbi:MAG: metallophosphoesterase family protein [Candidatus Sumerlaeia bacterium]